eukprot:1050669-Pleurochrysis_carterae.AAC.1
MLQEEESAETQKLGRPSESPHTHKQTSLLLFSVQNAMRGYTTAKMSCELNQVLHDKKQRAYESTVGRSSNQHPLKYIKYLRAAVTRVLRAKQCLHAFPSRSVGCIAC